MVELEKEKNMKRVIVTGAGGCIGSHVVRGLAGQYDVTPLFHEYIPEGATKGSSLDITDAAAVVKFIDNVKPDAVVNLAAIADPDTCEKNKELAKLVNVQGAENIAKACANTGVYLIHYSTDLVFDGQKGMYTEEDPVNPLNLYAKTKADSEKVVLSANPLTAVLRTAIVYGKGSGKRQNFSEYAIAQIRNGKGLKLFTDQYRSFLYVEDETSAISALIESSVTGIYHACGGERKSRYDFTVDIMRRLDLPTDKIEGISMDDIKGHAPRPKDCSLDNSKIKRDTGWRPSSFDKAMPRFKLSLSL
ncbi:dTDP-4-dehydrorhamnose reductase [hydrothermal vent metagenome]|uniref:dTDP-4-dehydrorhamnose reductase n=1 Tax=hydrothermal vent metagenome TaxID=652676 RepID=A0A3B1C594_9ZZZZ